MFGNIPATLCVLKFLDIYEHFLDEIDENEDQVVITGDFNCNILSCDNINYEQRNQHTEEKSRDFLYLNCVKSLVSSCRIPTRTAEQTAMLLDNIFTSINPFQTRVHLNDQNDHCIRSLLKLSP